MFFAEEKLEKRIEELEGYRYREVRHIGKLLVKEEEGGVEIPNPKVPDTFEDFHVESEGYFWSGWDKYLWLHAEAKIPEEWQGKDIVGLFDFGKTGGGNNSGFEAMLYMEGKPYQAVDSNHQEVFFGGGAAGKTIGLTFRLWSGMEGGGIPTAQEHRIQKAAVAWLDGEADDLYYLGKMMLETACQMPEGNPQKYQLLRALEKAFRLVDWAEPGSDGFYESVHQADRCLNEELDGIEKKEDVTIHCVGHTHIDMAWLWRLKHTREKASRSFSTVLRLMERFDDYIFLQTQMQLYEYIKKDFPEIYDQIKKRIQEGRWEIDGAMWVEADCNLPSGESLTRQILVGTRFMKEEFGKEAKFLWLPDVFGYSWALPQILKNSGINTFMTTKISWNEFNRMPHDTFYWTGMDGSQVLTHFVTTPDADSTIGPWFYTYNGMLTPYTVKGVWEGYNDKNLTNDLLISYGFGDGGGGVNREMLEQRRRMDRIPGLPNVRTGTAGEYFRKLQEDIKNTEEYVHTWDGELYLEFHRGTYTSHAYNKKMNRKMEYLYREAEWMAAMAALKQGDIKKADQERLTEGWKIILRNQFHDIIPGSAIFTVYDDSKAEYAKAEEIGKGVEEEAFCVLAKPQKDTWTVLNNAGWSLDGSVAFEESRRGVYTDASGCELPMQRENGTVYVKIPKVPAMGALTVHFQEGKESLQSGETPFTVDASHIETPFYSIDLNEKGQITRIYDKEYERDVLAEGERANVLQVFEDKPNQFDAWNIDIFYQEKMREIDGLVSIKAVECGSLRAVLRMEWKYRNTTVWQDMILYADSRRIDFVTKVDFHEQQQLMKVCFPVNIRSTEAVYDIQYGNVKRPNNWNTSWEMAKFETVGHRFADLSERGYGVSLLNDCKYGYDIKENRMRLTLLKGGINPDYKQDQGMHEFTYALYPHGGDFVEGCTVQEAHRLNQPLKAVAGAFAEKEFSFLSFDKDLVEVDAVKRSEDGKGLIVRFHEYTGAREKIRLHPGFAYRSVTECDLMERPFGEAVTGEEIELTVTPYEIKTLYFEF